MILTYHEIDPEGRSSSVYVVTCAQFEEHLRLVVELRSLPNPPTPLPQLTFDDGCSSLHRHALPLLANHRLKAVFFALPGWTETRSEFMTWSQLREVVSLGHSVQSHGWSHRFLTYCSDLELENELVRSKKTIEDKLGVRVETLSAPGGRWDGRVLSACAKAGYQCLYTSDPWSHSVEREGIELRGRLTVRRTTDARHLRQLLRGEGVCILVSRTQYRMKESFRRLVGDRIYHRIWCRMTGWDRSDETMYGV